MSRSDYERPAFYQVNRIYRCRACGHEQEVPPGFSAQMPCPMCGGYVDRVGESYPGDPDAWDEVKVGNTWVNKNDIPGYGG